MRSLFVLSLVALLGLATVWTPSASAQCILANPSFEVGGQAGAVFGGWNQFGDVGSVSEALHGSVAARVRGSNSGPWSVSGFWQALDSAPGESWSVRGFIRVPAVNPLSGENRAIVNVEWRDAADDLIDYDSFSVADANTPTDRWFSFDVTSSAAPAGTVSARVLLGALQSPTDPTSDTWFDQISFLSLSGPTMDEMQWYDFPGERTLSFSGYDWRVKGPGYYGPGPNTFCDEPECVWVDDLGQLHMTIQPYQDGWKSTELVPVESLGYGDYILTTITDLDLLDPQVVLGIFLWQYGPCWDPTQGWWNPWNEIDIEYSRWGDPGSALGQFVAQPYDWPGNLVRFETDIAAGERISHRLRWDPDRVEFRAWRGGPADASETNTIHAWTYEGPHVPRPEQPRLHLNLWHLPTGPSSAQEVVFESFLFVPRAQPIIVAADPDTPRPGFAAGSLRPLAPNPFNPRTLVSYELRRGGHVQLDVYDLAGRHVRTLDRGHREAGSHEVTWTGVDDAGRGVSSGVYLVRLRGSDFVETRRGTLVQ